MKLSDVIIEKKYDNAELQLLYEFPTEILVQRFYNNLIVMSPEDKEWPERLRMAQTLVNKALTSLPKEMSARGADVVLCAIEEMESLKTLIDLLCEYYLCVEGT